MKTIDQLNPNDTIDRAQTVIEIQQNDLTTGTQSRKLTLQDLKDDFQDAVSSLSADYTITGRQDAGIFNVTTGVTDRTITLPAGSAMVPGDLLEVHKVDSGTGKVVVSRAGSDTIDGVTSIDIDSQYDHARLRWSGTYWALVEYKDHGSNSDGEWVRYADGTMEQTGSDPDGAIVTSASSGNVFVSAIYAVTYPIEFVAIPLSVLTWAKDSNSTSLWAGEPTTQLTTGHSGRLISSGSTGSAIPSFKATGRWRA